MTTPGDLVARYLDDPGPATLAELRHAVRAAPGFRADLAVDEVAGPLLLAGRYDEALAALQALMPGALFSPSAHVALAEALTGTGRPDAARREIALARAAVRSILSTGDGTRERPWSVLRLSDEYDVLRELGTRPRRQEVVRDGGRHLDRIVGEDGHDRWFDATGLLPAPARRG